PPGIPRLVDRPEAGHAYAREAPGAHGRRRPHARARHSGEPVALSRAEPVRDAPALSRGRADRGGPAHGGHRGPGPRDAPRVRRVAGGRPGSRVDGGGAERHVRPLLGRTLLEADEAPGAADVVVLGYQPWQTLFGGDPDVIGRTVRVGGTPHTIVGVM